MWYFGLNEWPASQNVTLLISFGGARFNAFSFNRTKSHRFVGWEMSANIVDHKMKIYFLPLRLVLNYYFGELSFFRSFYTRIYVLNFDFFFPIKVLTIHLWSYFCFPIRFTWFGTNKFFLLNFQLYSRRLRNRCQFMRFMRGKVFEKDIHWLYQWTDRLEEIQLFIYYFHAIGVVVALFFSLYFRTISNALS